MELQIRNEQFKNCFLGKGAMKLLIMHAKNIKLYHTAEIRKLCHKLSDAQKSCINKYSVLQCA